MPGDVCPLSTWFRRPLELLLGTGIPLVGFFSVVDSTERLGVLWLFLPAIVLAGWHILKVNDLVFDRGSSAHRGPLRPSDAFPVLVFPVVSMGLMFRQGGTAMVLLLVMLNWDVYALWGKRHWGSGLLHNLVGGGLHFLLGAVAAGAPDILSPMPLALYFALTMTGAAFHHDALHADEDRAQGYRSGAVVFGKSRWWRLGLMPLLLAQPALILAGRDFLVPFAAAFAVYFALYLVFSVRANSGGTPIFRSLCRLIYAVAGLAYLAMRMHEINS
jgi:4-hydroxybenzoate polyprenyltransferase